MRLHEQHAFSIKIVAKLIWMCFFIINLCHFAYLSRIFIHVFKYAPVSLNFFSIQYFFQFEN